MCREDGYGCDGSSLQKTKIDDENGPRMVDGNSKKESKDYVKRWKEEKERGAFLRTKSGAGGMGGNDDPASNVSIPFEEWSVCTNLYATQTCGYGSSSVAGQFSDINISTSPGSFNIGDLTVNLPGSLDYSMSVSSASFGGTELNSGFGLSFDSLNSIKVSGEMSATFHQENISGTFATGISHEYKPGNQLLMQTVGGMIVAAAVLFPQVILNPATRRRPAFGN